MTAETKKELYDFFKTASDFLHGVRSESVDCVFSDDSSASTAGAECITDSPYFCAMTAQKNSASDTEQADVLIVAQSVADTDAQDSEYLLGADAGQLLDKMLAAIQLRRKHNCFAGQNISVFLDEELQRNPVKCVLVLGESTASVLLNSQDSMEVLHGQFFDYKGTPIMATFAPARLLEYPQLKRPAWADLQALQRRLNNSEYR